jgi:asparagine synthase (glutamine-hydrolysing)
MVRALPARVKPGADKLDAWLGGESRAGTSYEFIKRMFVSADVARLLRDPSAYELSMSPAPLDTSRPLARQVMDRELRHFLGDMLLRDNDAMSGASSLEIRVPFLDDKLVSWAARMPPELRVPGGKRLLSEAMAHYVPAEIRQRRKQGFILPFAPWLLGPLRQEADEAFAHPSPLLTDVVDPGAMSAIWTDYTKTGNRWVRAWSLYSLNKWVNLATSAELAVH